jgi:uncharacterized membrane protein
MARSIRTAPSDLPKPLAKLVKLLRKRGGTAMTLKDKMGCSKPTIYARLARLGKHGYKFKTEDVREGSKGPLSTHYRLAR